MGDVWLCDDRDKEQIARHQWLTPVILATQEVEIRGLLFKFSLGT
jgi:hypothetical protein